MKSGWAAAVLLEGPIEAPTVLASNRVELADRSNPKTVQPYHAAAGTAQTDQRVIAALLARIDECAAQAIADLVQDYRSRGWTELGATVVRASDTDPATIANPHIRIHALEGQLFPRVTVASLQALGIRCRSVLEADLIPSLTARLGKAPAAVVATVAGLGKSLGGPWRAEQKVAALAAWDGLLQSRSGSR